jgi:hypothetical protein
MGFVAAVAILLLNDFVLKEAFGNALTGKLSDFAGLFAFALFWIALIPARAGAVCAAVGAAFVLWKSPAAQPAIDAWNARMPFAIERVVDATDLVALVSVVAAYWYAGAARRVGVGALRWAAVPASLFSFAATSLVRTYTYHERYRFPFAEPVLAAHVDSLRMGPYLRRGDTVAVWMADERCEDDFQATLLVRGGGDTTRVDLVRIDKAYACRNQSGGRDVLRAFERCFVARLGGVEVGRREPAPAPAPDRCRAGKRGAGAWNARP